MDAMTSGENAGADAVGDAIAVLVEKLVVQNPRRAPAYITPLRPVLERLIARGGPNGELAGLLSVVWNDARGIDAARALVSRKGGDDELRRLAFDVLVATRDPRLLDSVARVLALPPGEDEEFHAHVLSTIGRLSEPEVARVVLEAYGDLPPGLKARAIDLLTQRALWARSLVAAVAAKRIPMTALNLTQLRKLQQGKDPAVAEQIKALWGTVRGGRNPEREHVAGQISRLVRATPGDPVAGQSVFKKLCAECHKIYGEGQDVGPEITSNGRNDFEQLISNIFDPSLVIGPGFQATTVATSEGRVLTGLLVEDGRERVVLKLQGGKVETIARDQLEEMKTSPVSLMPEEIERQLSPQEIVDLCAFLCLDKPPSDPAAKPLRGSGPIVRRSQ
jgi:putative heme-binding domain-containing protein